MLSADDIIVDQSSLSQYQIDKCVRFDEFDFDDNKFVWNTVTGNYTPDRIDLTGDPIILGESYTQEVWIYRRAGGINVQKIIGTSYGQNSPPGIHINKIDGFKIVYGYGNGGAAKFYEIAVGPTLNRWTHIAVTKDTTNLILYINGEEVDHITWCCPGQIPVESPQIRLGHNYVGKMDNVRMWNLARTQEQIQEYMYEDVPSDAPGLVANYRMDLNNDNKLIASKTLLSKQIYDDFNKALKERSQRGHFAEITFIGIKSADIKEHKKIDTALQVTVDFVSEIITCIRDKEKKIVSGSPDQIKTIYDTWTFSRDMRSSNPNWLLVNTLN